MHNPRIEIWVYNEWRGEIIKTKRESGRSATVPNKQFLENKYRTKRSTKKRILINSYNVKRKRISFIFLSEQKFF